MALDFLDRSIMEIINKNAEKIEDRFKSDVIFYNGQISPIYFNAFRNFIEDVRSKSTTYNTISVFLRTGGGSAETTERMVSVLRHHYEFVNFIVPDMAMSAGTIFCMSGDKIYMDYSSSLGPIDPQIPASDSGDYVPAMGYLDKIDEIQKRNNLTQADVVLLKSIDLAKLALFEQAHDLSIDLLKKWLVEFKFKNWHKHRTTNPGADVTVEEKIERAAQIAKDLADHKKWRSHGRNLDIEKLKMLRIDIDDYSNDVELRNLIRGYNDPITGYLDRIRMMFYLHNRLV